MAGATPHECTPAKHTTAGLLWAYRRGGMGFPLWPCCGSTGKASVKRREPKQKRDTATATWASIGSGGGGGVPSIILAKCVLMVPVARFELGMSSQLQPVSRLEPAPAPMNVAPGRPTSVAMSARL